MGRETKGVRMGETTDNGKGKKKELGGTRTDRQTERQRE